MPPDDRRFFGSDPLLNITNGQVQRLADHVYVMFGGKIANSDKEAVDLAIAQIDKLANLCRAAYAS